MANNHNHSNFGELLSEFSSLRDRLAAEHERHERVLAELGEKLAAGEREIAKLREECEKLRSQVSQGASKQDDEPEIASFTSPQSWREKLSISSTVQIYSVSKGKWFEGVVTGEDSEQVEVSFKVDGEILMKKLARSAHELAASGEEVWTTDIDGDVPTRPFFRGHASPIGLCREIARLSLEADVAWFTKGRDDSDSEKSCDGSRRTPSEDDSYFSLPSEENGTSSDVLLARRVVKELRKKVSTEATSTEATTTATEAPSTTTEATTEAPSTEATTTASEAPTTTTQDHEAPLYAAKALVVGYLERIPEATDDDDAYEESQQSILRYDGSSSVMLWKETIPQKLINWAKRNQVPYVVVGSDYESSNLREVEKCRCDVFEKEDGTMRMICIKKLYVKIEASEATLRGINPDVEFEEMQRREEEARAEAMAEEATSEVSEIESKVVNAEALVLPLTAESSRESPEGLLEAANVTEEAITSAQTDLNLCTASMKEKWSSLSKKKGSSATSTLATQYRSLHARLTTCRRTLNKLLETTKAMKEKAGRNAAAIKKEGEQKDASILREELEKSQSVVKGLHNQIAALEIAVAQERDRALGVDQQLEQEQSEMMATVDAMDNNTSTSTCSARGITTGVASTGNYLQSPSQSSSQLRGVASTGNYLQSPSQSSSQLRGVASTGNYLQSPSQSSSQLRGVASTGNYLQSPSQSSSQLGGVVASTFPSTLAAQPAGYRLQSPQGGSPAVAGFPSLARQGTQPPAVLVSPYGSPEKKKKMRFSPSPEKVVVYTQSPGVSPRRLHIESPAQFGNRSSVVLPRKEGRYGSI